MISVRDSPELKAAAILLKNADKATRAGIAKETKTWAPTLRDAALRHAANPVDRAIAASGKTTSTAKGMKAVFGSTGKLPSGVKLAEVARPYEFGSFRQATHTTKYLTRHGVTRRAYWETRHTHRQLPASAKTGRFIYPAVADVTPTLVARYVRAIAKAVQR